MLRKSDRPENWLAREPARLGEILSETRTRGYGLRDETFIGGPYGTQSPDGLAGIAVPLLDRGRVHGVINIIWPKPARTVEEMVAQCLPDLQSAAAEIVALTAATSGDRLRVAPGRRPLVHLSH